MATLDVAVIAGSVTCAPVSAMQPGPLQTPDRHSCFGREFV
jgi:hypothetical protein